MSKLDNLPISFLKKNSHDCNVVDSHYHNSALLTFEGSRELTSQFDKCSELCFTFTGKAIFNLLVIKYKNLDYVLFIERHFSDSIVLETFLATDDENLFDITCINYHVIENYDDAWKLYCIKLDASMLSAYSSNH